MFTSFFYYLRANGLDVSVQEWMTLCEALDQGLVAGSFTRFYDLCRMILVRNESELDLFDRLFLQFFKMVEEQKDALSKELMDWLDRPEATPDNYNEEAAKKVANMTTEEIEALLKKRLMHQRSEHDGGDYWVGTGGMSAFGNAGNAPYGIRVGGKSMHRRAFRVAGERSYRDFRKDQVVDLRQFQMALRYLRQYTSAADTPKTELSAGKTVDATCDNGGRLQLVYEHPRRNAIRLLMLMDSGGSMETYSHLCATLFQAVSKTNRFKDLKICYFHNCVRQYVFSDPSCMSNFNVSTAGLMKKLNPEYRLIIVGDAEMGPEELMRPSFEDWSNIPGIDWFRQLKKHFRHAVWLNPGQGSGYIEEAETFQILKQEFDMYPLTIDGMKRAMKRLMK